MKNNMKIKRTFGDKVVDILIYGFVSLLAISIILPFWTVLVESVSIGYTTGIHRFWPSRATAENYRFVLSSSMLWTGYRETIIQTICGTILNMVATTIGAYSLSKKNFPLRKLWTLMIVIPMFFTGGLIPTYLWNVQLGLRNTRLVLIMPGLISSYNLIVMRNFFSGVPDELEESAHIDGANNIRILISIILPVSTAMLATISLWCMVSHWNAWFEASIYINKEDRYPLQIMLKRIISMGASELAEDGGEMDNQISMNLEGIKSATIFVCLLPIMCVYPFIQKYFMKGTLVGSVKG